MILFIIILCAIWFCIGFLFLVAQEHPEKGASVVVVIIGGLCTFITFMLFFLIKGEDYFKPVYRKGDSVVYRETQYGRVDTIMYIINKDTVYYDEIKDVD